MASKETINYRKKRKKDLVYIMGGKCAICGYNKCQEALEFHHIDKSTKLYSISGNGICHKFEDDINEIKKCVLLCSNCHKEIEVFHYEVKTSFNEDRYNEIITQKNNKNYCKKCNKLITYGANYCCECSSLLKRKSIRPDRDVLKELIRNFPFTQIGLKFNVTDNSIRKWCDNYNLPRTKKEINSFSEEEWKEI